MNFDLDAANRDPAVLQLYKKCTQCCVEKPADEFYIDFNQSTGLRPNCKQCVRNQAKEYRNKNIRRIRKKDRKRRKLRHVKNREQESIYARKRYLANRKEILKLKSEYKKKHFKRTLNGRLIRTYGITIKQYYILLRQQKYKCAVCKKKLYTQKDRCVDHNHKTNKNRGIICRHCNWMLGHSLENPEILRQGADYLEKYENF